MPRWHPSGIGTGRDDLEDRMGSADIEGRERLVYMNETPSADDPKVLTLQTVTYVFGRIEGIAVSQVTAN